MVKKYIKKYGLPLVIVGGVGKLISITLVFVVWGHWFGGLMPSDSSSLIVYVHPGDSEEDKLRHIMEDVNEAGGHGERLFNTIDWRGWSSRIKAGKYSVEPDASIGDIAKMFAAGDRQAIRVLVPAGRDLNVIAGKIAPNIAADSSELSRLIAPEGIRWQIIPNTYEMWWEIDAQGVVDRLLNESDIWWNESRLELAEEIGLTPEEVVILASIVSAETAVKSEAPIVAGLYLNRLNKGTPLQADPTLIYASNDTSIKRVLDIHKEIDSPYNTYKYAGLPPGTIRTPEPTYIDAVLNATDHDYLFMCAKPGGEGTHNFAKRYSQHLVNARKYQSWLNKNRVYR